MSVLTHDPEAVATPTERSQVPVEEVISGIAATEEIAALHRATRVRLGDLIRVGSEGTTQRIGSWGEGAEVCALSTAAHGLEALKRL